MGNRNNVEKNDLISSEKATNFSSPSMQQALIPAILNSLAQKKYQRKHKEVSVGRRLLEENNPIIISENNCSFYLTF